MTKCQYWRFIFNHNFYALILWPLSKQYGSKRKNKPKARLELASPELKSGWRHYFCSGLLNDHGIINLTIVIENNRNNRKERIEKKIK